MRLRFLGTGHGACKIKKVTSKEFRRPTCLLIDDTVLINPTAEIFEFEDTFGYDKLLDGVQSVILTHLSEDSTAPEAITKLAEHHPLSVWATEHVLRALDVSENLTAHAIAPFSLYEIGEYRLMTMAASAAAGALSLALCRDRVLYFGIPCGIVPHESYAYLRELRLDCAVLDCALGDAPITDALYEHLTVDGALLLTEILKSSGALTERTRVLLANLPTDRKRHLHEELVEHVRDTRLSLTYDSYFLTI